MNPKYPVFVPTKGRWESRLTLKLFEHLKIPYHAVIESQEYENYARVIDKDKIIVLPHSDKGLVVTRNWIWDYAQELGTPYFWTFDDNIRDIFRLNKNVRVRVKSGTCLCAAEDFTERYENIAISGFQYRAFSPRRQKWKAFKLNTRIYSNMLIRTDIPYRNRDFYNDDTDLCLQVLKDGWCTVLFYAFIIGKQTTMTIKGGMTPHYQDDGRLEMARSLKRQHPKLVKIVRKWGRWQHQVDYRPFRKNKLIPREGVEIPQGVNNYGMKLVKK